MRNRDHPLRFLDLIRVLLLGRRAVLQPVAIGSLARKMRANEGASPESARKNPRQTPRVLSDGRKSVFGRKALPLPAFIGGSEW